MFAVTVLAVVVVFFVLGFLLTRIDGLAWFAPRRTRQITDIAQHYCTDHCRQGGVCPLVRNGLQRSDCPMWHFVEADLPTVQYGSPFAHLHAGRG